MVVVMMRFSGKGYYMRWLILSICVAVVYGASAQNPQQLLQALSHGELGQEQFEVLNKQAREKSVGHVRRTRSEKLPMDTTLVESGSPKNNDYTERMSADSMQRKIFGHDLFTGSRLTFEPNLNIATPRNYLLGAGDEVIVDIWGDTQLTICEQISPEGRINVEGVGLVPLAGLTIEQAGRRLKNRLSAIYQGLCDGSVEMRLSLGAIRSIQVNIMGEVKVAGTYTLPSLATLFHALYIAHGVSDVGTMRSLRLYRNGELLSEIDVYNYILRGDTQRDVVLQEGDLVVVPTYDRLVTISGEVKRPMCYEMKPTETLADVINFAGGFTNDANRSRLCVTRRQGGKSLSFTIEASDFGKFELQDGDEVEVGGGIDRHENRVRITGAVYREGYYALDDKVTTLRQLIACADGLREDAFMSRAILYREKPDWTTELLPIDLTRLMAGEIADVELRANDWLMVPSVEDIHEEYQVSIYGEVRHPGTYPFAENMTVEDLIVVASGLRESASMVNVTITRRIKEPRSVQVNEKLFEIFTIELNDSLRVDDMGQGFKLQPFDQVYVRRSPVYVTQSSISVRGEVAFEGNYPLSHRNMRLSEAVKAAGGVNPGAYLGGAYLLRKLTDEERLQRQRLQQIIDEQRHRSATTNDEEGEVPDMLIDSVVLNSLYPVGIDLSAAITCPQSDEDVVLRDGDVIYVPEYNGTTRVMGAVHYPNTVTYAAGKKLKYYIKSAGGFDNTARRRRVFVIHMNGMVESGLGAKVRPGSIIVVPTRVSRGTFRWGDVVQGASSAASLAAVIISAIGLAK